MVLTNPCTIPTSLFINILDRILYVVLMQETCLNCYNHLGLLILGINVTKVALTYCRSMSPSNMDWIVFTKSTLIIYQKALKKIPLKPYGPSHLSRFKPKTTPFTSSKDGMLIRSI